MARRVPRQQREPRQPREPKQPREPRQPREPNAKIAELYGYAPSAFLESNPHQRAAVVRGCPIRGTACDVSSNRHRTAILNLSHPGIRPEERDALLGIYGPTPLPMGICSCWTRRQNETVARPWILCPKRLLVLDRPVPVIPPEVKTLIDVPNGARVRVWSELKFRRRDSASSRFFEYTFDYLLMQLDAANEPVGPPYIIEVMTSSTRGGGLTEHMVDVLSGRPQRALGGVVDSVYTPNYRQVFERMLGQLIAKSEIAEHWGGRTIWVLQDVLLDYIEQTTDFHSDRLHGGDDSNVFMEVYSLADHAIEVGRLELCHAKSIRGRARASAVPDVTSMLGLGYAPPLEELRETLRRGCSRNIAADAASWFDFTWGQEADPTGLLRR